MGSKSDSCPDLSRPNLQSTSDKEPRVKVEQNPETMAVQPDHQLVNQLESEVRELKEVCKGLVEMSKMRVEQPSVKSWIKPRDIPVLELTQLKGVDGEGKLSAFLDQVEMCASSFEERKQILKTRLDAQLNISVQALMTDHEIWSWSQLRKVMIEGLTSQSKDRIFDVINEFKYDLEEDPYYFVNQLKYKLALLDIKTGSGTIVNKDKLIKQKLIQGLPKHQRDRLELYKEAKMPLNQFLERFNHERATAQATTSSHVRSVGAENTTTNDELCKKIADLESKLARMNTRRWEPSDRYCPYCRTNSHTVANCRRNPPPGSCYDCLRMNCRRGQAGCPGRAENRR